MSDGVTREKTHESAVVESVLLAGAACVPVRARELTPVQKLFRRQIGLPDAGAVVMSGHQAQVWHPGVLAKLFALDALVSKSTVAHAAWVIVDQDDNDPLAVFYPACDREGGVRRGQWIAGTSPGAAVGVPTGLRPLVDLRHMSTPPADAAHADVTTGLAVIAPGWASAAAARGSLAMQSWNAALFALQECGVTLTHTPTPISALTIGATELFRDEVRAMTLDAARCVRAYNMATREHPRARLRPLAEDAAVGRWELPVWRVAPGAARARVRSAHQRLEWFNASTREWKPAAEGDALAPRALLMTYLLRSAGCELFLHGTGGAVYDRAMEAWIDRWRGGTDLAPTGVVSATVRWPAAMRPEDIDHAVWAAHAAEFDPAMLGDAAAGAAKRELARRISQSTSKADRRSMYMQMHALLGDARSQHAAALADVQQRATHACSARKDAAVLGDRTYPFPLYGAAAVRALRERVERALRGESQP